MSVGLLKKSDSLSPYVSANVWNLALASRGLRVAMRFVDRMAAFV
jgi:hypothetical protein